MATLGEEPVVEHTEPLAQILEAFLPLRLVEPEREARIPLAQSGRVTGTDDERLDHAAMLARTII